MQRRTPARFVFVNSSDNCHAAAGIVVTPVKGAVSYTISYWDGYYQRVVTGSVTVDQFKQNGVEYKGYHGIPKGELFTGVTGGWGSGPCKKAKNDPTYGGRFSKGAKAWAVFPYGYRPKPSLAVALNVDTPKNGVDPGTKVQVAVKVTAGLVPLTSVDLVGGLKVVGESARLVHAPSGLNGFALGAGRARTFTFTLEAVKDGTVRLAALATGRSKSGSAQGSDKASLRVGIPLDIDWTMPNRLTAAEAASWSSTSDGVAPSSYVYPKDGWTVRLFLEHGNDEACPSGDTFRWTVKGGGKTRTLPEEGCSVTTTVPKLGIYGVTAKEYHDGIVTGLEFENAKVVVRDWLIVGMGDSNGSGQGNPPYLNKQCDRGVTSYQYKTAQYIEDHDPRSSVTFLFASCSGARTDHLWQNSYEGQEPGQGSPLRPQLFQVEERIDAQHPTRTVDAAIVSIGINNIQFGSIMSFCAKQVGCNDEHVTTTAKAGGDVEYERTADTSAPTLEAETLARLKSLPQAYQALDEHLKLLQAAHVYLTEYPDETTDQNGALCGGTTNTTFQLHFLTSVWRWLAVTGRALNDEVDRTRALGWTPVTGIPEQFKRHGYCSTDSYFRGVVGSLTGQWNPFGSFHATAQGHQISADATRTKVCEALYGNATCDGIAPAPK